jgi:hypothetical protein
MYDSISNSSQCEICLITFIGNYSDYEIMWKNILELDRPLMAIWHMNITCWIPKATDAHQEYLILLFHCNSDCMNVPQSYVVCTLPVLLKSCG